MINLPERLTPENETLHKLSDRIMANLRVAAPGIIQSFDSAKQTVTVQLAIREKVNLNGEISWKDVPLLVDVPIVLPRAGGFVLTMPITVGDECLVVFGDRTMDAWYQSGGIQNQTDRRYHDLSDGYAVLGTWSQPHVVSGYSTNSAQLRTLDGSVKIDVASDKITMSAPDIYVSGDSHVHISGNTSIESVDWLNHQHTGVAPGDSLTGGVSHA